MPLTTISSLRVVNEPSEADRLIDVALNQLEAISDTHFSGRNYTIRDLIPLDAPSSPTANEWTDTPGTDNTWDDNTLWDGTAISDDTVMLLYGFSMPLPTTTAAPSATALRITVGANGRVEACSVTGSSGSSALDDAACRGMQRYARYNPALNAAGNPISATTTQSIRYVLPD